MLAIATASITPRELLDIVRSPYSDDALAAGLRAVVVDPDRTGLLADLDVGSLPLVVIGIESGVGPTTGTGIGPFDLVMEGDDPRLVRVLATIERHPIASTSLVVLLRASATLTVDHALGAESAVYSTLQGGAEFGAWRAGNQRSPTAPDTSPAVLADRDGDVLHLVLNRPQRHNAFSRAMRDALAEMLALAVVDETICAIRLSGNGPSFSSGGDLGEFGSFADAASAHMTRLVRSPARLLHQLAARTHVSIHGACMGAGIELSAFAGHVTAHPDTVIALPEIDLGLIPGAGGTVSIPRRIGRQRTALLALGGPISASTALAWGLVDEINPTTAVASRP